MSRRDLRKKPIFLLPSRLFPFIWRSKIAKPLKKWIEASLTRVNSRYFNEKTRGLSEAISISFARVLSQPFTAGFRSRVKAPNLAAP